MGEETLFAIKNIHKRVKENISLKIRKRKVKILIFFCLIFLILMRSWAHDQKKFSFYKSNYIM